VAPATAKRPTGRHGGLNRGRRLLRFASLHGKKSYIQRRQQTQKKKRREREMESEKEMPPKKKRTGESGVIKGMGAQYRKEGEGEMQCYVYFSLLAPAPFCCCI